MKLLGIDPSTYTGVVFYDGEDFKGKCIHFDKMEGCERLASIRSEFRRTCQIWKPDFAIVENYAIGHSSSVVAVVSCATIIRLTLYDLGIPWLEVRPTVLKKWTTGSGNANKVAMAAAVKERWSYQSPSDDIIDAYSLCRMGLLGTDELLKIKGVVVGK